MRWVSPRDGAGAVRRVWTIELKWDRPPYKWGLISSMGIDACTLCGGPQGIGFWCHLKCCGRFCRKCVAGNEGVGSWCPRCTAEDRYGP